MNILFFDFETDKIPEWKLPSEDPCQPHWVEFAAILANSETQEILQTARAIIKPDGWIIPDDVAAIHGITTERALAEGIPEIDALDKFLELFQHCQLRVAHNSTFDNRVARIALKRYRPDLIADEVWKDPALYYCTMVQYSKMFGGKWPKLGEAHEFLFNEPVTDAHSAMGDTKACMRIYFELQRRAAAA